MSEDGNKYKYYEVSALYRKNFIVKVSEEGINEFENLEQAITELIYYSANRADAIFDSIELLMDVTDNEELDELIDDANTNGEYINRHIGDTDLE